MVPPIRLTRVLTTMSSVCPRWGEVKWLVEDILRTEPDFLDIEVRLQAGYLNAVLPWKHAIECEHSTWSRRHLRWALGIRDDRSSRRGRQLHTQTVHAGTCRNTLDIQTAAHRHSGPDGDDKILDIRLAHLNRNL